MPPEIVMLGPDILKSYQEGILWAYYDRLKNVQDSVKNLLQADTEISSYLEIPKGEFQLGTLLDAQKKLEALGTAHEITQYEGYGRYGFIPE